MKFNSCYFLATLPLLFLSSTTDAFSTSSSSRKSNTFLTSSSFIPTTATSHRTRSNTRRYVGETVKFNPQGLVPLSKETMLTPEGYGFTAPVKRILEEADRANQGYYRASSKESILTVIAAITGGEYDAALAFDDDTNEIVGLFTESDYINFSKSRAEESQTEEQSASFLISDVKDYVTPFSELMAINADDTANVAISAMKSEGLRHLVVADKVTDDFRLTRDSKVTGVINMQDVMALIQKDERLSMTTLAKKYPGITSPVDQMQAELISEANRRADNPETARRDIIGAGVSILSLAALATFLTGSDWMHENASLAMIAIFVLGYIGIIFEEVFEFNKAAVALLMSTGLWVTYADYFQSDGTASGTVIDQLGEQLAEVSDICFFLLAASTIVEVVDLHQGFKVVTNQITTTSKKQLFWVIGFLTFFLSAILNNLTVTIVMCSLLKKLVPKEEERKLFGAMVVVAANAGGVWTPIGDVTTTMLWINNQLSTIPTVVELFLPSLVCLVGSLAFLVNQIEEDETLDEAPPEPSPLALRGKVVFWTGIASLLSVPVFNDLTGLPPYLAMLTGLGAMWTLTDVMHMGDEKNEGLRVPAALSKLDTAGILFFLGILMSIGALDKSGLLKELAEFLSNNLPNLDIIATVIGIASALIDNVPLVAATMGMYDLSEFGTDDRLWQLIALCAGTGGSILVIGSASGVALMGLEKVDFLWYAKKVSLGAAIGYFAGIATYLAQTAIFHGGASVLPQAAVAMDMVQQTTASIGM